MLFATIANKMVGEVNKKLFFANDEEILALMDDIHADREMITEERASSSSSSSSGDKSSANVTLELVVGHAVKRSILPSPATSSTSTSTTATLGSELSTIKDLYGAVLYYAYFKLYLWPNCQCLDLFKLLNHVVK